MPTQPTAPRFDCPLPPGYAAFRRAQRERLERVLRDDPSLKPLGHYLLRRACEALALEEREGA